MKGFQIIWVANNSHIDKTFSDYLDGKQFTHFISFAFELFLAGVTKMPKYHANIP